ncbi:hypothetical protein [Arenimonas aestuarii]
MNRSLAAILLVVAAGLAACSNGVPPAQQLAGDVEIVELEPAGNGARQFRLSIAGDARHTFTDHAVALMMALTAEHCGGQGYGMGEGREDFPLGNERPVPGQPLSIKVTCQLGLLPNHRIVEAGSSTFDVIPLPAGKDYLAASAMPMTDQDRTVDVVNRLIGDFVRQAYTEDCAQGPLVIERIETATESGPRGYPETADGEKLKARVPQTHAVLTYRCLEQDPDGDA